MRKYLQPILLIVFLISGIYTSAQVFLETSSFSGVDIVPETEGYMGGGMAWFDYDNDGYDDLYVTGCKLQDKLFHNNGNGSFTDVAAEAGLEYTAEVNTVAVATGDIDNDGDRDILLATWKYVSSTEFSPNLLYRNNGDGTFTEISQDAGLTDAVFTMCIGFLDVNLDGWIDIHAGNYVSTMEFIMEDNEVVGFNHDCFPDMLYINNGDNTFTESSELYGINNEGCTLAVAATDYDLDGDQDLMVANDFGEFIIPDRLYRNDYPLAQFTDVSIESGAGIGMYAMGIANGDYDEDQDFDYYVTNLGRNVLLNQEDEIFTDVTDGSGTENESDGDLFYTSWGTFFWDCDNDSYLELFVANGHMPSVPMTENVVWDANQLYRYDNGGTFTDIAEAIGVADTNIARGSAYSDYDRDGDLDFGVVNILNNEFIGTEHFMLYENHSDPNNWIEFYLEGVTANRDAFGSVVHVYADDRIFIREYSGLGGSHASQHGSMIHVGLGQIESVDSVQVIWPGGQVQTLSDPDINAIHEIVQENIDFIDENPTTGITVFPNPVSDSFRITGLDPGLSSAHLVISDGTGRVIFDQEKIPVRNGSVFVALPSFTQSGVYQVQISGDNMFITQSIVVH